LEALLQRPDRLTGSRGALLLAAGTLVTIVLQWAAGALGPAGIFINLSIPLPAAYALMRRGALVGSGIVVLSTAALFASGGAPGALGYLLQFGLASLTLPYLLRRGWPWDRAVAGALLLVLFVAGLVLAGYGVSRGVAVTELVNRYVHGEVESALALYQKADIPQEQLEELRTVVRHMADFLVSAWPALMVAVTGAILLLMVLILSALSAGRYEVPGIPFRLWKAPEKLIWLLILAGFGVLYAPGPAQRVALNVLTILLPLYFLQGLAVLAYFFQRKGIPPFLKGLGYLLVVVLNPLPLILTAVGVFDLWADFRKPRIKKIS
jgi:uncharacterized protein YybS (DUF2232 family)